MSSTAPTKAQRYSLEEWYVAFFNAIKTGKFSIAARMAWPWMKVNPWTTKIFDVLAQYPRVVILGHASAAKTFTSAAWCLLNWWYWVHVKDWEMGVIMTGPTIPSMRQRAWGDMKRLFHQTKHPLPGKIVDHRLCIRLNELDDKHTIQVTAGDSRAESKIRGLHTPKLIVDMDEADNPMNEAAWEALDNLEASGDVQIIAKTNPTDPNTPLGMACEPVRGWGSVNIDSDHEWDSRLGWHVLRLDGLRSPNIVAGRDEYPFLMKNDYVAGKRKDPGERGAAWFTYVRAWFPEEGMVQTVFPRELVNAALANKQKFYGETTKILAFDPAFSEGGDRPVVGIATVGREARDPMKCLLRVDSINILKRRNNTLLAHQDYAMQCADIAIAENIDHNNIVLDNTGAGLACGDILCAKVGPGIMRVGFGGAATVGGRILGEDSRTCDERFDRFVTELWFAGADWMKANLIFFSELLLADTEMIRALRIDLEARRFTQLPREKSRIESKKEMKERNLPSPDIGDMFNLLVLMARRRFAEKLPSALPHDARIVKDYRVRKRQQSGIRRGWNFKPQYGGHGAPEKKAVVEWPFET